MHGREFVDGFAVCLSEEEVNLVGQPYPKLYFLGKLKQTLISQLAPAAKALLLLVCRGEVGSASLIFWMG